MKKERERGNRKRNKILFLVWFNEKLKRKYKRKNYILKIKFKKKRKDCLQLRPLFYYNIW